MTQLVKNAKYLGQKKKENRSGKIKFLSKDSSVGFSGVAPNVLDSMEDFEF